MKSRSAQRRGMTLIEVIIASSLMLILLTAFYAVAEALKKSQVVSDARLEARQNLRNAVRRVQLYFSHSSWLYRSVSGGVKSINGYACILPYPDPGDPENYIAGDTLAFAVPLDLTRLTDPHLNPLDPIDAESDRSPGPDGFHDNRYQIVVFTSRPHEPADSRNADARQLVLMRWDDVRPPIGNEFAPVTIDLESLGQPDHLKIYDAYLKPLADEGFRINYLLEDSVPAAAIIHADFRYIPPKPNSPAQSEEYNYVLNARNIF